MTNGSGFTKPGIAPEGLKFFSESVLIDSLKKKSFFVRVCLAFAICKHFLPKKLGHFDPC